MTDQLASGGSSDVRIAVRERYGAVAEQGGGCCTPTASSCCGSAGSDVIQLDSIAALYEDPDVGALPEDVTGLSLGCGDPVTLATLRPGQTVLDLGAGGGIDCFLAAKKVGPAGRVIGVDMTPAMIDRARRNQAKVGADNVEFRLGEIEHLPVADNSVDVIISNCVINLSPDKEQVFREGYRVLKPGGRLAVSDIVTEGPLPPAIKNDLAAWAGCVAGALDVTEYVAAIKAAGFVDVELVPVYWEPEMVAAAVEQLRPEVAQEIGEFGQTDNVNTAVFSAKVTARKKLSPV
ncbi:MAG: arsenite methyltransferase [Anaerolineae bacterium]|nr:arsenite methyltransferase [Anaerolineae bacterium]